MRPNKDYAKILVAQTNNLFHDPYTHWNTQAYINQPLRLSAKELGPKMRNMTTTVAEI